MTNKEILEVALYEKLPLKQDLILKKPLGLEIEMSLLNKNDKDYILNEELISKGFYETFDDTMLFGTPLEIATPKFNTSKEMWNDLEKLSSRMKKCQLNFDRSAFQVNIDSDLNNLDEYYLILFFITFEHIIYKFSQGFDLELRVLTYARSLRIIYDNYLCGCNKENLEERIEAIIRSLMWKKCYAIALKNDHPYFDDRKTTHIEFRTPNGCDDVWLWQNYINTFHNLLESIKTLDLDYIDKRLLNFEKMPRKSYMITDIEDALKFAHIIFKNDLDKCYFLKQYIGRDISDAKEKIKTLNN